MNLTWTRRLLFIVVQAAALLATGWKPIPRMEAGAAEIAVSVGWTSSPSPHNVDGLEVHPTPKYVGVYTQPPNTVGSLDPSIHAYRIPDGPLMGNGDIAVAVGGTATEQTFYLSKSDLSHSARGIGGLTISFKDATAAARSLSPQGHEARADELPAEGSKYRQEQDLYQAEVRSVIPLHQTTVKMRSWTADGENVLVTEMRLVRSPSTGILHEPRTEPAAPVEISLRLWSHTDRSTSQAGTENGVIWSTREMNATIGTTKQPFVSKVAVATRIMGITPECSTNGKPISSYQTGGSLARFSLPEGKSVRIITVVAGGHNAVKHVEKAKQFAAAVTARKLDDLHAAHREWWKTYWSKSSIAINDLKSWKKVLLRRPCMSWAVPVAKALFRPDWQDHGI